MVVPQKLQQYSLKALLMVDAIKFTSHGALFHFNNNNFKNDISIKTTQRFGRLKPLPPLSIVFIPYVFISYVTLLEVYKTCVSFLP